MDTEENMNNEDFAGIYSELASIVGGKATVEIFSKFKGQQVTFPTRLYTPEYVVKEVEKRKDTEGLRALAVEFGYTERWLRKLLKGGK